ncbi:MAG TPA: efflux RND transporter periplasmic adaptor subunit [Verrucomicrobiae bacterium]|nr:efflux RND transporter periplasmic adaptor subunit [Verrucomicrobiae bacterium]
MTRNRQWQIAGIVLVVVVLGWLLIRHSKTEADSGNAGDGPAPIAAVVNVERQDISSSLNIASEFLPFQEIDVYAKESGYIKKLYIDWGTHVKQGQLMAELEIPELQQQLQGDQATVTRAQQDLERSHEELTRAQSAYQVAHVTYTREAEVQKTRPELISQEEIDVAQGKDLETSAGVSAAKDSVAAGEAALANAKASLAKDNALYAYARMTAPFNGVVTKMYAYTGALLPAGTSSNVGESALCRLSQNDLLRLVIPVPEHYAGDIKMGEPIEVKVSALNRAFTGQVVRFSDQIDLSTRTMHTEVQVPNPKYELIPGMYADVQLPVHADKGVLTLPVQAVLIKGNDTGIVLIVDSANRIDKRNVTVGIQTANRVEILSGVKDGETAIYGEQDQFQPGMLVKPQPTKPAEMKE